MQSARALGEFLHNPIILHLSSLYFFYVVSENRTVTVKKARRTAERRHWTEKEQEAVARHFSRHIALCQVPRKDECIKCKEAEPSLNEREWKAIKYFVHTAILRKKGQ